ncbi:SET and MYND domain-containing protein 4 [Malaya genurostris]|uniref:SET and MYND domain-containing protein 4 n=1 Tax=Malaya genurostris TaxID=325434 RepID=UPI0026F3E51B|nr:SET and MYND domain-containing protein 4 [Malaya genurostris]
MENGWDSMVAKIVRVYKLTNVIQTFHGEVETIRKLQTIPEVRKACRSWLKKLPSVRTSDEEKSHLYRENGNEIFRGRKCPHVALEAYSKSIFAAPRDSTALAMAHANRAIVLMSLKRFREAYEDCQLALEGAYPEENRLRVLFRQAECALQVRDREGLEKALEEIGKISNEQELATFEIERFKRLQQLADLIAISEVPPGVTDLELNLPQIEEKVSDELGRYMVAKEDIKMDSPIVQEKAASFVPVYDPRGRSELPPFDCQYCGEVNVIPFPCSSCGRACYCSITCRQEHIPVHRYECPGYEKHLWYLIGIAHLGIRCFLDGFQDSMQKMNSTIECTAEVFFEDVLNIAEEQHQTYHYGKVLRLVTNLDKMSVSDMVQYSLTAYMLSLYLSEFTDFFKTLGDKSDMMSKDNWIVYAASVILRHIGQLVCNGHAISELRGVSASENNCLEQDSFNIRAGFLHRYYESTRVFTGIFPQISMFNHSCDPNIRNYFNKSVLTVYATKDIEPGGEIFNCYGPNCKLMNKEQRNAALKQQYCFDCKCSRCVSNKDDAYEKYEHFKCPFSKCAKYFLVKQNVDPFEKDIKCPLCRRIIDCSCFQLIASGMSSEQESCYEDFEDAVNAYNKCALVLSEFHETKITLAHMIFIQYLPFSGLDERCLRALKKLAQEFIHIREHRFGKMSPEYVMACFYLMDLVVIESKCEGEFRLDQASAEIINDFKQAIEIFGNGTRTKLLNYLKTHLG